jgi:hypothetical protein
VCLAVSKEKNQDLFWTVRGAGQNFDVAIQFLSQGRAYGTAPVEKRIASTEGGQAYAQNFVLPDIIIEPGPPCAEQAVRPKGRVERSTGAGGFALGHIRQ